MKHTIFLIFISTLFACCLYLSIPQKFKLMGNSSSSKEESSEPMSVDKGMNSIAPIIIQPTIKHTASVGVFTYQYSQILRKLEVFILY
jgi:hypothetical protein